MAMLAATIRYDFEECLLYQQVTVGFRLVLFFQFHIVDYFLSAHSFSVQSYSPDRLWGEW